MRGANEIVGEVLVANEAKLEKGEAVNGRMQSAPVHVKPSAEVNVVYTFPGTKSLLKLALRASLLRSSEA